MVDNHCVFLPDLVTTIIPVFNRAAMLREAVASVLAQTYRPIEILIVDDGSVDDAPALAEALAATHPEIRVFHQSNRGPGLARELGRQRATGEFIQYLDSDDVLESEKFALQVKGLRDHPECGASYGWTRLRKPDRSTSSEPWKRTGERIETMFPAFLQSRWWDTSTPLFRRAIVDAAGPWRDLRVEEDWEYDARVASLGTKLHYCPEWVSETRQTDPHRQSLKAGPAVMADRARAHALIYEHAVTAGIGPDAPEMKHFARELFLLARQCGAASLEEESKRLFSLAREASGPDRDRLQFRGYAALARSVGWITAGKLATMSDRLRWQKSRS
jgi:cellulose synthase/poly-beta-1,6-N-acetylglucosamine synthase-like glycosyltransferase